MSQKKSSGSAVFVMTRCGILAAMAVILYYIEIPVVAFYKLEMCIRDRLSAESAPPRPQ